MSQVSTYDGRSLALEPVLSWSAIFAGAVVGLAISVFLTLLAAGFGYDVAAGGLATRQSLTDFTPQVGAGAVAIQVISAGIGGYLAGRLRHAWPTTHLDEAHFRDTAQGLIAWALATVAGLTLAATVIGPAAAQLAAATTLAVTTGAATSSVPVDPVRAAHILAQSAFFTAVGMLLSAFIAAVAARIGGLRTEHMLARP
jgi:hypothetical protein